MLPGQVIMATDSRAAQHCPPAAALPLSLHNWRHRHHFQFLHQSILTDCRPAASTAALQESRTGKQEQSNTWSGSHGRILSYRAVGWAARGGIMDPVIFTHNSDQTKININGLDMAKSAAQLLYFPVLVYK